MHFKWRYMNQFFDVKKLFDMISSAKVYFVDEAKCYFFSYFKKYCGQIRFLWTKEGF